MKTNEDVLATLKTATEVSLDKHKRFTYYLNDDKKKNPHYLEQYIQGLLGEVDARRLNVAATPSYSHNLILALAFTKAFTLYEKMRQEAMGTTAIGQTFATPEEEHGDGDSILSTYELLQLSTSAFTKKNKALQSILKKNDIAEINRFKATEKAIFAVLREMRNFHSHVIHQPGPVMLKDLYEDNLRGQGKPSSQDWQLIEEWLTEKLEYAKAAMLEKLQRKVQENGSSESLKAVINRIENVKLLYGEELSNDAKLFFACMFLRKSDASFCIKKWTGAKRTDRDFKELHNFYGFYSIRDKKSIKIFDQNLLQYRKLVGILSTLPVIDNIQMLPIYKIIKLNNQDVQDKLNELKEKYEADRKKPSPKFKIEAEALKELLVPLRKDICLTSYYLQYLWDTGELRPFQIAVYKSKERRALELDTLGYKDITLAQFKINMKLASEDAKPKLRKDYKELKRNFYFISGEECERNAEPYFCIKKRNAFIRIPVCIDGIEKYTTVTLSPDFIMKWVFLKLQNKSTHFIPELLKGYATKFINSIRTGKPEINKEPNTKSNFPYSVLLMVNSGRLEEERTKALSTNAIAEKINRKKNELENFKAINQSKKQPWKFASKRKIDLILEYNHFNYCKTKYESIENNDLNYPHLINIIRHQGLNEMEYMDVYDYIRAFRTEKHNFLKYIEQKQEYFAPVNNILRNSQRIEDIFNDVIDKYILQLNTLEVSENNKSILIKLFGIKAPKADKTELEAIFTNSVAVSPTLLSLSKHGFDVLPNRKKQPWDCRSDFQAIRNFYKPLNRFTNSEYMFNVVLPQYLANMEGTPHLKSGIINHLNKLKTEELILTDIAFYYRNRAIEKGNIQNSVNPPVKNPFNTRCTATASAQLAKAYKKTNPFYSIQKKDIEKRIVLSESTAVTIKIPASKFDDEYLYYESASLGDYLREKGVANGDTVDYVKENAKLKDEISKAHTDLFLLMTAEKYVAKKHYADKWQAWLDARMQQVNPTGYYVEFNSTRGEAIGKFLYSQLRFTAPISLDEFVHYRNKTLHQDYIKPSVKKVIRKALLQFCQQNNAFEER